MRTERSIVILALVLGLFAWVVDAVLDYLLFYRGGEFWELMLAYEYAHEAYIRCVILAVFVVFGLVVSRTMAKSRRAEEALRKSEERFRSLFENAPLGYQSLDEQGNFVEVNETWCKTLGYSRQEVLGRNFSEFVHPDFGEHFKQNFPKFKSMGYILGVEFEMVRKDGSEIVVAFEGRIARKPDGSFQQTHCILRDVTGQKQAEEELQKAHRELEQRVERRTAELNSANERLQVEIAERRRAEEQTRIFRRFAEASGQGLAMATLDGRVTFANRTLCRMLDEQRPEDTYGKSIVPYYPERLRARLQQEILPKVMQKGQWVGELALLSTRGRVTPTIENIFLVRGENGEPLCLADVMTDISERKQHEEELQRHHDHLEDLVAERTAELQEANRGLQETIAERERAEEALRYSEQRYRSAYDTAPLAFVIWDLRCRVRGWNDHAEKIFGWPREEIEGKDFFEFLIPRSARPGVEQVVEALLHGEAQRDVINENLTKSGCRITCQWNNSILRDGAGNPVAVLSLALDITDRMRVEAEREKLIEQLEAQNAELERFTYTVSHDLKSPLITLKGYLGLLKEDLADGSPRAIEDDMSRMTGAADKMGRLLEELLELSRIGRVVNPSQHFSLEELAREAVELVSGRIAEAGVQVEVTSNLPVVLGDRPRLVEVLQNLLDNAVKYMGHQPHPRIEIGTRLEGDETICYVRDNGVGVDPRYHEKIFGLFDQLDQHSEGSGIGLALVKRIVEVHGGRIWVESEGPGQGAAFCFTLPAVAESVTPQGTSE